MIEINGEKQANNHSAICQAIDKTGTRGKPTWILFQMINNNSESRCLPQTKNLKRKQYTQEAKRFVRMDDNRNILQKDTTYFDERRDRIIKQGTINQNLRTSIHNKHQDYRVNAPRELL